jgi:pyruvate formate lyase activating enzyme
LHFGRFVPEYRLKDLARTSVPTLEKCRAIGLEEGLKFVYIFNLSPHPGNNTVCPGCHKEVITRLGFKVLENRVAQGRCGFCRAALPGIWA